MDDSKQFDPPADLSSGTACTSSSMQEQYESLRKLFLAALFALVFFGFSLNIFLMRQMIFVRKELEAVRPQINQMVENYTKNEEPQIRGFVNSLITYSQTHPDFNPVLAKYKIVATPQAAAAPAAPAGAPAAPAKKK